MKSLILTSMLLVCLCAHNVVAFNLPGPRVFVVTPSPRTLQIDEGRARPFYYHNWMRRMDTNTSAQISTVPTTKAAPKVKTPDLIFAEFESDSNDNMKKSIRKLLEKEKVIPQTTTTTTMRPIYVPGEESKVNYMFNYDLPMNVHPDKNENTRTSNIPIDYYSMYSMMHKNKSSSIFMPVTTQTIATKTLSTTTTAPELNKVENIWQIIDSEKNTQYSGNWQEVPIETNNDSPVVEHKLPVESHKADEENIHGDEMDDNFAIPGFGSNPGNGAENESRAIRYEPNMKFPYVNLKTFQLKPMKTPSNDVINHKKENIPMTNLNNFHDLKHPVRGEAQDVVPSRGNVDRYNPAQPYLPPADYGSKTSKQNSVPSPPKATAMLVPPPPPSKSSDSNFPAPANPYESFPPYSAPFFDSAPSPPMRQIPPKASVPMYSPPVIETSDDFDTGADSESLSGYTQAAEDQYNHPAPPVPQFLPTAPPVSKPFPGYSYDKPPVQAEMPMMPDMDDNTDFHGYHYGKPDSVPEQDDDIMPSLYGPHDAPPPHSHDSSYPEIIFEDFKGPHHFEDHDFEHHYHHHHPTTTTTTTEMPRVNRYSYYYLGKKLYYLPLYFSIYFIVYVGALIIKAVLRHKIVYPNSWRPNGTTATFFSKRSVEDYLSNDNLHEVTGRVTHALATAAKKYFNTESKNQ